MVISIVLCVTVQIYTHDTGGICVCIWLILCLVKINQIVHIGIWVRIWLTLYLVKIDQLLKKPNTNQIHFLVEIPYQR